MRVKHDVVDGVRFTYLWAGSYVRNNWQRWLSMSLFGSSVSAVLVCRRLRRRTILIGSSPHLLAAFGTWLASAIRGQLFVLEVRDLWPEAYLEVSAGRRSSVAYRAMRWMADLLYRRADAVIVLAEANREHVAARGTDRSRIWYIPNGVNLEEFAAGFTRPSDRARAVRFMYVGAHGPANGLDVVVRACEALERDGVEDVEVILVGDGPTKVELAATVIELGLRNIQLWAPVPKRDIPSLLATADVGLMVLAPVGLFTYGVSPNKLFDYLAANLPVLTNVPGLVAEIVRMAGAGRECDAGDPEALATAMRSMARAVRAEPLRFRSGRTYVEQHFDRQALAGQLDELLQGLLIVYR
jgi:glycosyltransferase involved in cell wall biosynthesis